MALTFATHDIVSDSPTNNFATWNVLAQMGSPSISEGNLKVSLQASSADGGVASMLPVTQKYYWETLLFSGIQGYGLMENTSNAYNDHNAVYYTDGRIYVNGSLITNGATTATSGDVIGVAFDPVAQTIQFFKNNSLIGSYSTTGNGLFPYVGGTGNGAGVTVANFGQDPTFGGNKNTPATVNINGTNVTGPFAPSGTAAGTAGLFYYPPPAGAKALCTANLPDFTPTVTDDTPQDYFKTVLWTGKTAGQDMISYDTTRTSIHGTNPSNIGTVYVGWKPDLAWLKIKSGDTGPHNLYDSLRVDSNNLHPILFSNSTNQENTNNNGFEGFVSNGFELNENGGGGDINGSTSRSYVGWCWKAAGSPSATDDGTGVSGSAKLVDTSGAASSTTCKSFKDAAVTAGASNVICPSKMSINQAAGFSIVSWSGNNTSGATYPHGLSKAPEFIITKTTNAEVHWIVYSSAINSTGYLSLPDDFLTSRNSWFVNNTPPSISVITSGYNSGNHNDSAHNYITYCWHSVEGYSKFGSYIGNDSATGDGPYIHCGFRPALVMYKGSNISSDPYSSWGIADATRSSHNPTGGFETLWANRSTQEGYRGNGSALLGASDVLDIDFLSGGFKIRGSNAPTETNDGPWVYIFMAFAEQPFKYANAR
jgi:hypothetical protein